MKLTKIIATIGPASESEEMIEKLILKGVNIFRFNFKHNEVEWHENMIQRVQSVAKKLNIPVGTLIDLQGPEIRIILEKDEIEIKDDERYEFGKEIKVTHPQIFPALQEEQHVVIDDGAFRFTLKKDGKKWMLESHSSGTLKNKKTITIPGGDFPVSLLVDRDLEGIRLAADYNIDFVALSFVRTAEDIIFLRQELKKLDISSKIVAKLETQKSIHNLDSILNTTDIAMIARGDLGVEFPLEHVPSLQKKIIKKCLERGVPVITATQMLESMIETPYPTRAEISDVANAVYDLTGVLMLSGETAMGKYPSKVVSTMARTARFIEHELTEDTRLRHDYDVEDQTELLCDAAYNLYFKSRINHSIAAFVVFSQSGRSATTISRYRPKVPIYAFVPTETVAGSLTINFGISSFLMSTTSIKSEKKEITKEDVKKALSFLVENGNLEEGKKVIVLHGDRWGETGDISHIQVIKI